MSAAPLWDNEWVSTRADTLIKDLSARLDEIEHAARVAAEARGSNWSGGGVRGGGLYRARVSSPDGVVADIPAQAGANDAAIATHIALHDPAQVLAAVEATRQVITQYEDAHEGFEKLANGDGRPSARQARAEAVGRLNAWTMALKNAASSYGVLPVNAEK